MDIETLRLYERYARPLTENDRKNLTRSLTERPEADYAETIREMLRIGKKLEQECIVLSTDKQY